MATPATKAKKVAKYFLRGDDYISLHERAFDNQWEGGDGDAVAEHFRNIYCTDTTLQRRCKLSRYFCVAMIKEAKS